MFDEREWALLEPERIAGLRAVKEYREARGVPLAGVPMPEMYRAALLVHASLSGESDIDPQVIWHHRRSAHGPACTSCGRPLRTPLASSCAACGASRQAV